MKSSLVSVFDIPNRELEKHRKRVKDIINLKAPSDIEKQKQLARTMAKRIMDIDKAYGRYLVADEEGAEHLGKIFLDRFKELTYTVHDWRIEKINDFLDFLDDE
jgi:hypothetical protein